MNFISSMCQSFLNLTVKSASKLIDFDEGTDENIDWLLFMAPR